MIRSARAVTHIFPRTMNAWPPNIRFSATSGTPASAARTRLTRSSARGIGGSSSAYDYDGQHRTEVDAFSATAIQLHLQQRLGTVRHLEQRRPETEKRARLVFRPAMSAHTRDSVAAAGVAEQLRLALPTTRDPRGHCGLLRHDEEVRGEGVAGLVQQL